MKVKEVVAKLLKEDQEKDLYVPNDDGEHEYYIAHSVRAKTLTVLDESINCVIIEFE